MKDDASAIAWCDPGNGLWCPKCKPGDEVGANPLWPMDAPAIEGKRCKVCGAEWTRDGWTTSRWEIQVLCRTGWKSQGKAIGIGMVFPGRTAADEEIQHLLDVVYDEENPPSLRAVEVASNWPHYLCECEQASTYWCPYCKQSPPQIETQGQVQWCRSCRTAFALVCPACDRLVVVEEDKW